MQELQAAVKQFTVDKGLSAEVGVRMMDLTSEVGELAKEVLKATQYGRERFKASEAFEEEMGDVLFSLICTANEAQVDLARCLQRVLEKYEDRFRNKGHIASGDSR